MKDVAAVLTHEQKDNFTKMANFRSGKCRVLIATDVIGEGVDVPTCNLVVLFPFRVLGAVFFFCLSC